MSISDQTEEREKEHKPEDFQRFAPGDRVVCVRWNSEWYGLRGTIVSSKMRPVPSRVRGTWEERVHVIFDTAEVAHDDGGDGYLDEPDFNYKEDMIPF